MIDKRTCLIDADSIIYFSTFTKVNEPDKTFEDCKKNVDDIIFNILNYTKSTHYVLFLTVGRNFRYNIYPQYKANRKYGAKPEHFDKIKEYMITHYKAIFNPELEADDLCCIYHNNIKNSFLASSDKDILNLQGDCFDYKNFKWVNTSKKEAELYFWTSMITGDKIDNIKGIPGKGIKFAETYLSNCENYAGHVLSAYISNFGEENGIKEFYKNYMCLKMKTEYELTIQEPIEFNKYEDNYKLVE